MRTQHLTGKLMAGAFVLFLGFTLATSLYAQGGYGSAGGSGNGDQTQQQDRDQDQDRLQDGTGDNCVGTGDCDGTPDQDQLQTQDRDRLQDGTGDGTPDQDRDQDRDRIHVESVAGLEEFVRNEQQNRLQAGTQEEDGTGVQVRSRVEAQIAADAVSVAEPLLGRNGPRMSDVADQVDQAIDGLATREEALQNRSRLQLFFFGSDDEAIAVMRQEMEQNQDRIEEMQQFMRDCNDCDQGATQFLVNQIQNLEREQNRLQMVVDELAGRRGLFGFLFGWLR